MTNSTIVAITSSGMVNGAMRFFFLNSCHCDSPLSCGAAEPGEFCEFVESFINKIVRASHQPMARTWTIVLLGPAPARLVQLVCQCLDGRANPRPAAFICREEETKKREPACGLIRSAGMIQRRSRTAR